MLKEVSKRQNDELDEESGHSDYDSSDDDDDDDDDLVFDDL